jgi:hypothetical protein
MKEITEHLIGIEKVVSSEMNNQGDGKLFERKDNGFSGRRRRRTWIKVWLAFRGESNHKVMIMPEYARVKDVARSHDNRIERKVTGFIRGDRFIRPRVIV